MPGAFDTTLGTGPASWYPLSGVGQSPAVAASAPSIGFSPALATMFGQQTPTAAPSAAPAPSLAAPDQSGSDFASLFPYLKLGLQGAGALGSGLDIPGASGGAGALSGLLGIGTGAATGNPGQIASGATGLLGGLNSLSGTSAVQGLLGTTGPLLGAATPYLPLLGTFLGGLLGPNPGTPAGGNAASSLATQTGIMSAVLPQVASAAAPLIASFAPALAAALPALGPAGAFAGPVLGAALAINQALNPLTNYGINKLSGKLGPQVTGNVLNTSGALNGVDLSKATPQQLEALVPNLGSSLAGFYNPVGAGSGTSTSQTAMSRYMMGLGNTDPNTAAAVTKGIDTEKGALLQSIAGLQKQGVDPTTISNLLAPQLNNIWNMWNSDLVGVQGSSPSLASLQGGLPGYQPIESQQQAANFYGGPTWMALRQTFGPNLDSVLKQYGITAPGLNYGALTPITSSAPVYVPPGQAAGYDPGQAAGTA